MVVLQQINVVSSVIRIEAYRDHKSPVGYWTPEMSCFRANRTVQKCLEGSHLCLLLRLPVQKCLFKVRYWASICLMNQLPTIL